MPICSNCDGKSVIRDGDTGNLACADCGKIQEYDGYVDEYAGPAGPTGTFVSVGTTGIGNVYSYRETKIYDAQRLIDDVAFRLGFSPSSADDVKKMAARITGGEYGQGNWFPLFVGACSYVVMRRDNKPMPIAEVAAAIGADVHELGRMITRVVDFLDLRKGGDFPQLDVVDLFERTLRNSNCFGGVDSERLQRMQKQGTFLMQCAMKWFLTTGRRPLPVVAAVAAVVAELNGVGVRIEELAKEVHAVLRTCRLRYGELLQALVKVAQALPWGKDVTVKNVIKNVPFVIQYMERKSMTTKPGGIKGLVGGGGLDLGCVVRECLRKDTGEEDYVKFFQDEDCPRTGMDKSHENRYFEVGGGVDVEDVDKMKLSHECLSMIYSKLVSDVENAKSSKEFGEVRRREKRQGFQLHACTEWWNGKSEMSKRLLLQEILEKDVGLDPMPPSFVNGCVANERRRAKINAAKLRINRIMHPSNARYSGGSRDACISQGVDSTRKKRRRASGTDWEDLIIETLLLHGVKEEEIEKGWYNVLLELHVFNSGVV